ncbi:ArnT family glycosyltransferase [Mangrovibacterium diazotrophicum]|nr:glycosyltransferase family 39 protein [Mangrovibacterium diazotrophicum]
MKQTLIIAFAILLALTAYYFGLFIDLTGDSGKYAAIARHVFESGDCINLRIHAEPYDQKPPLLFWLSALGFELWGLHNWSFKIFPLLYGFLSIFFTYQLGKTLYGKQTGTLAAIFLSTSEIYFLYTMDVHTDLILVTNVTLAIWQLAAYLKTQKTSNFIFAFVAIGLAMMSKGAIGAAIPAFALGTHLIAKRDFKQLFHPKWIPGILIALLTATPAFLGLINQFGLEGIKFFFITNNVGRITGEYAGSNSDPFFYLHSSLYLFLPWTFFLIRGVVLEFRQILREGKDKSEYLTTGGIWIFFIIASLSKGKAPHYIFMLIPMFMVITAKWLVEALEKGSPKRIKQLLFAQNTLNTLLLLFIGIAMFYLFPTQKIIYPILLILSLAACLLVLKSGFGKNYKLILPGAILISTLAVFLNSSALPKAFSYQASTKAAKIYNENAAPAEKIFSYHYPQYEIFFYAKSDAIQLYSLHDLPKLLPEEKFWLLTTEAGKDSIQSNPDLKIIAEHPLKNRGMNRAGLQFILPSSRERSLDTVYLIEAKTNEQIQ